MADIRINALANTATSAASDDYLALDGSANGTRKILATNIANNVTDVILGDSGPSVKSTLSARAPRQGLVFDGTSQATVANGQVIGTGDFTIAAWVLRSGSNLSVPIWGASGSLGCAVRATTITLDKPGTGTVVTWNYTVASDKFVFVTFKRSGTTATAYVDGVSIGDVTSFSTDFTTVFSTVGLTTFSIGSIIGPYIYNRALSAAEVVALYEAGAPSGADYNSASNTASYTSDFSAGTDLWAIAVGSASVTGNVDGIGGLNDWLQATASSVSAVGIFRNSSTPYMVSKAGGRYTYTFTIRHDSATVTSFKVYEYQNASNGVTGISVAANTNTSVSVTLPQGAAKANYLIIQAEQNLAIGESFYIRSFNQFNLGLLLAPDAAQAGGGYVWNDQSGNLAQIVLPSSGVQWNLPSVAGQRIRGTTSTNGNEQLLGASVLLPAECQITHVRARARSGTPTITIGTASGGAQIVASVALSTTWLNCTIALTGGIVSSADDIWVGSNSTDVVETDIAFQPLDF